MITASSPASKPVVSTDKPLAPKPAKSRGPTGPRMQDGSREARLLAAAILEVLGGARMPTDAAKAMSVSLPRYYQLESRALNGLLSACEPRPKGRVVSPSTEVVRIKKELQKAQQECARYSALFRASQRTIGLARPEPPKPAAKGSGKRPRRKATVRALKAAELLQCKASGEAEAVVAGEQPAKD